MAKLIAIAGGSGAGKTTIARALAQALAPQRTAIVAEDDYYICSSALPAFNADTHNFDVPHSKEEALLLAHLTAARNGEPFGKPLYDLSTHRRRAETETVAPIDMLIVEGLHAFASPALAAAYDLRVFIACEEALRLGRRMIRDVRDRARTPQSVLQQFFENVRPMHALHVAPQEARADLVLHSTYASGPAEAAAQAAQIAARL